MASLSAKRKEEIAAELDIVATWVGGPRKAKVEALAAELRGDEVEEPTVTSRGDGPPAE